MEAHQEKRKYQRLVFDSPMNMYRMDDQDSCFYARMNDYSPGGLSITTAEKLVIGQLVYLEMKNHDPNANGPEKHKSYSGCVRWSEPGKKPEHDTVRLYRYGLEYLNPKRDH